MTRQRQSSRTLNWLGPNPSFPGYILALNQIHRGARLMATDWVNRLPDAPFKSFCVMKLVILHKGRKRTLYLSAIARCCPDLDCGPAPLWPILDVSNRYSRAKNAKFNFLALDRANCRLLSRHDSIICHNTAKNSRSLLKNLR
jgi:hypothetical protein